MKKKNLKKDIVEKGWYALMSISGGVMSVHWSREKAFEAKLECATPAKHRVLPINVSYKD